MEENYRQKIDNLLSGGENYKTILDVLRESLRNISSLKLDNDFSGAVAFFKFCDESKQIAMNFFPLFNEIVDLNFPDDDKIKYDYLSKIIADRSKDKIHYVKHFPETYKTSRHFVLHLNDKKDIINHSKSQIDGFSWEDFIIQEKIDINRLDLLFFEPNSDFFTLLPLPILCSPSILLFLPLKNGVNYSEISSQLGDIINNYIYNRLINEIKKDLNLNKINSEESFIKRFIEEFKQVTLPIKYKYNDDEEFTHFVDWFGDFCTEDAAQFELTLNREKITFILPSFCWDSNKLIHTLPLYKVKEKQVKETIQNIFDLVFINWQILNDTKKYGRLAFKQIIEESGLNRNFFSSIIKDLKKLDNKIEESLEISQEEFESIIDKVSSKEVLFKMKYNEKEMPLGYDIIYNKEIVTSFYFTKRNGFHFGYDAFQEIMTNKLPNPEKFNWNEFSFVENVREEIMKNKGISNNQNYVKEVENYIEENESLENDLDHYGENINEAGSDNNLDYKIEETFKYLKADFEVINKVFNDGFGDINNSELANSLTQEKKENLFKLFPFFTDTKKSIDEFYYYPPLKNNDYFYKKMKILKSKVDSFHKKFKENFSSDYLNIYSNSKSEKAKEIREDRKQFEGFYVGDNRVSERIANNVRQVINSLSKHKKYGEIFKNHFDQSGLYWGENTTRKYTYSAKSVEMKYTLNWKFE